MKEIWKDIEGYEGLYQVSNLGNVRSLDRYVKQKENNIQFKKGNNIYINKQRYSTVNLWKNNKMKTISIHRLVAKAFLNWKEYKYTNFDIGITYTENNLVINHKDNNKNNNVVNNLEWCTISYNNRYGGNNQKKFKKVYQYNIENKLVNTYKSIQECARINKFNGRTLNRYCHSEKKYKGFIWSLKERGGYCL